MQSTYCPLSLLDYTTNLISVYSILFIRIPKGLTSMARLHRMPLYTLSFCILPVGDSHFSLIFQHMSIWHIQVLFYIFISNILSFMYFCVSVYIYVWDGTTTGLLLAYRYIGGGVPSLLQSNNSLCLAPLSLGAALLLYSNNCFLPIIHIMLTCILFLYFYINIYTIITST